MWEWGGQKRKSYICAVNAQSGKSLLMFRLLHRRRMPAMKIPTNSRQTIARNNSWTKANYIWARSCGNGEASGKSLLMFRLLHRRRMPAMKIPTNSRQTIARNNSWTKANYIWARSCGNGEAKIANPPFVQSTHKEVRACKLFLLYHRSIIPEVEIRANFQQILPRNDSCTNANYIWARSWGNGEAKNANPPFA